MTENPMMIAASDVAVGQRIYCHGVTDWVTGVQQNEDGTATVRFHDGRTVTGGFFALVADRAGGTVHLSAGLA